MKELREGKPPTLLTGEWWTLAETLDKLGKSQSTLERLVGQRVIASRLEKREGRKPERLYKAADVEAFAGQGSPETTREAKPKLLTAGSGGGAIAALFDVMTKWGEQQGGVKEIPITEKLHLTIAEAAQYTGYGEWYIQGLIDRGLVKAGKNGPRGCWVISRKSLEEIEDG